MKVSLKWLNEYVDLSDIQTELIIDKLNLSGLEVEEVMRDAVGNNLVIGKVLDCIKHPESDHLKICKVDIGDQTKIIVCGAPNVANNQKVIVALPGANLPAKNITIAEATIRGIKSSGMICSLTELGVAPEKLNQTQKEGIEILPEDAPVGYREPLKFLNLDDIVLDLKVTPNRADCLSIIGLAYEIAAIFNKTVKLPQFEELNSNLVTNNVIRIESTNCHKFSLKRIENIQIRPSLKYISDRLIAIGIKPINNIVDIGNYVMTLLGTPLHMYDGENARGKEFIIKENLNEVFMGLDGKNYQILEDDIFINVGELPGCLAGILGAQQTAINLNSKSVIIEAAVFNSYNIRKTAQRLDLNSQASNHFSKGVNENYTSLALKIATSLILESCPEALVYKEIVVDNTKQEVRDIRINIDDVNKVLGTTFNVDVLENILYRLKLEYQKDESQNFLIRYNSRRSDLRIKEDIIEEVIRLQGFENLNSTFVNFNTPNFGLNEYQKKRKLLREYLIDRGFFETLTYTLTDLNSASLYQSFNNVIKILNPIGEDRAYLRTSLLPALLKVANYNVARQNTNLALFELSNIYTNKGNCEKLAVLLLNNFGAKLYQENSDFYLLKGVLEGILDLFGIDSNRYYFKIASSKIYHPYRSAELILEGKTIGVLGQINSKVAREYSLSNVLAFEIDLTQLFEKKSGKVKYKEPSKYPIVNRDIAIVVDKKHQVSSIIKTIKKTGGELVTNVELFDIYTDNNIGENMVSLAISITFTSYVKTLIDQEIKEITAKILGSLEQEYSAKLRG